MKSVVVTRGMERHTAPRLASPESRRSQSRIIARLRQLDKHELCSSDCIGTKRNFVGVSSDESLGSAESRSLKEIVLIMRIRCFTVVYGIMLMLGMSGLAVAQDDGAQKPSAREQLQHIHTPQSIDQKPAQLKKDLELTSKRQSKFGRCFRSTTIRFRRRAMRIRQPRDSSLVRRFTRSVTKRTTKSTLCLPTPLRHALSRA